MNMPRFTAEASLYQTCNHYHVAATRDLGDGNTTVTPQGCGFPEIFTCALFVSTATVVCGGACASGIFPACLGCVLTV
jgi:hypothetical protein